MHRFQRKWQAKEGLKLLLGGAVQCWDWPSSGALINHEMLRGQIEALSLCLPFLAMFAEGRWKRGLTRKKGLKEGRGGGICGRDTRVSTVWKERL